MYGLLMLLPQNADYTHLRGKLTSVTRIAMAINHKLLMYTETAQRRFDAIDFKELILHFDQIQRARAVHSKLIAGRASRHERHWTDSRSQSPVGYVTSTVAPDSPFGIVNSVIIK